MAKISIIPYFIAATSKRLGASGRLCCDQQSIDPVSLAKKAYSCPLSRGHYGIGDLDIAGAQLTQQPIQQPLPRPFQEPLPTPLELKSPFRSCVVFPPPHPECPRQLPQHDWPPDRIKSERRIG